MSTHAALGMWVFATCVWIAAYWMLSRVVKQLRALCRRVADHLNAECHTGIKDIETHRALAAECERAGWDEKGNER